MDNSKSVHYQCTIRILSEFPKYLNFQNSKILSKFPKYLNFQNNKISVKGSYAERKYVSKFWHSQLKIIKNCLVENLRYPKRIKIMESPLSNHNPTNPCHHSVTSNPITTQEPHIPLISPSEIKGLDHFFFSRYRRWSLLCLPYQRTLDWGMIECCYRQLSVGISFECDRNASNRIQHVVRLLKHYTGYTRDVLVL